MKLHIRTLLLAVALLSGLTSTASACCLLEPFHWLFGCRCYHGNNCGPVGYYGPQPAPVAPAYGCYQPSYPALTSPCAPCAPVCPLLAIFRMPCCLPTPAIFRQCWDPCGMQSCAPPMQPPMVQYQSVSYMPQQYSATPMMQTEPMGMGCDGSYGMTNMPEMMPDYGCCGDEGMMYPDVGMQGAFGAPTMAWSPQSQYSAPVGYRFRPGVARRQSRAMSHLYRRMQKHPAYVPVYPNAGHMPTPYAPYGYPQPAYPQPAYAPYSSPQMGYAPAPTSMQMTPTTSQWTVSPSYPATTYSAPPPLESAWSTPANVQAMQYGPAVAGDIMGDHEIPTTSAAMIPVVPNSYNGVGQFTGASLSRPLRGTFNGYPKSVR